MAIYSTNVRVVLLPVYSLSWGQTWTRLIITLLWSHGHLWGHLVAGIPNIVSEETDDEGWWSSSNLRDWLVKKDDRPLLLRIYRWSWLVIMVTGSRLTWQSFVNIWFELICNTRVTVITGITRRSWNNCFEMSHGCSESIQWNTGLKHCFFHHMAINGLTPQNYMHPCLMWQTHPHSHYCLNQSLRTCWTTKVINTPKTGQHCQHNMYCQFNPHLFELMLM